jgi:hypothetical protein
MNGFYTRQYSQDDLQQLQDDSNSGNMMGIIGPQGMQQSSSMGAQSLDEIVNQNEKELRRRSMPLPYGGNPGDLDSPMRRVSMMDMSNMSNMMEFGGSGQTGSLDSFQFDPATASDLDNMSVQGQVGNGSSSQNRRPSNADLSINTQFPTHSPHAQYGSMEGPGSVYPSPLPVSSALDMDMQSPYITSGLSTGLPMSMDMNLSPGMFDPNQYHGSPMMTSPVHQSFPGSGMGTAQDSGGGGMSPDEPFPQANDGVVAPNYSHSISRTTSGGDTNQSTSRKGSISAQGASMPPPSNAVQPFTSPKRPAPHAGPPQMINGNPLPWAAPPGMLPNGLV